MKKKSYMNPSNILQEGVLDRTFQALMFFLGKSTKLSAADRKLINTPAFRKELANLTKYFKDNEKAYKASKAQQYDY